MKTRLQEDLMIGDLEGLVLDRLLIEVLKPRSGEQKASIVFSLCVKQRGPAFELFRYIKEGQFDIKNIEASNRPDKDGNYQVSITLKIQKNLFDIVDEILRYLKQLVNINRWYFIYEDAEEAIPWNRNNFNNAIKGSSGIDIVKDILRAGVSKKKIGDDQGETLDRETEEEDTLSHHGLQKIIEEQLSHYGKSFIENLHEQAQKNTSIDIQPKSTTPSREEIENVIKKNLSEYNKTFTKSIQEQFQTVKDSSKISESSGTSKKEIEEIIGKQLSRHGKAFVKSLQEQIQIIRNDNSRLSNHIDDLKSDQQHLHQQLQLYQKREKIAILREQEDYKRIRGLEKKLALLAPPEKSNVEIVIPPANVSNKHNDGKIQDDVTTAYDSPEIKFDEDKIRKIIENTVETVTNRMKVQDTVADSFADSQTESDLDEDITLESSEDSDSSIPEEMESEYAENLDEKGISEDILEKTDDMPEVESTTESKLVDEYFALGMAASEKKEYSEAIKYYSKVTELLPEAPPSYFNLSVLYYRLNEYEKAKKFAQKAIDLGAKSAKFIIEKITAKEESLKKEQDLIESEIEIPEQEQIHVAEESPVLPVEDLEIMDSETETVDVSEIETVEQDDALVILKDEDRQKKKEEADKIESKPNDPGKELFALGMMASEHKEYQKAIDYFLKSIEYLPDSERTHLNMAILYSRQKEFNTAKKHAEKAIDLGSESAHRVLKYINNAIEKRKNKIKASDEGIIIDENQEQEEYLESKYVQDVEEKTDLRADISEKDSGIDDDESSSVEPENNEITVYPEALEDTEKIEEPDDLVTIPDNNVKGDEPRESVNKSFESGESYFSEDTEYIPESEIVFEEPDELFPVTSGEQVIDEPDDLTPLSDDQTKNDEIDTSAEVTVETKPDGINDLSQEQEEKVIDGESQTQEIVSQDEVIIVGSPDPVPPIESESEVGDLSPDDIVIFEDDEEKVSSFTPLPEKKAPVVSIVPETDLSHKDENKKKDVLSPIKEKKDYNIVEIEEDKKEQPKEEEKSARDDITADDYFAMGLEASDQKDYRKAIEYFMKVTDLLPDASPSYYNLANLHLHLKNYESSKKYAKRAISLGADQAVQVVEKINEILDDKEKKDEASRIHEEPEEAKKEFDVTYDEKSVVKVSEKQDQDKEDEKKRDAEKEVKEERRKEASVESGKILTTKEQKDPAPKQKVAVNEFSKKEKVAEVDIVEEDVIIEATEIRKEKPKETPKQNFILGLKASEKKENEKAINYFQKVIAKLPNSTPSLINLAVLYYRLQDYETAKKHANKALQLGAVQAKRILRKIDIKIKKQADSNFVVETVEPPTEEVFIWGADDFDGEAVFSEDEVEQKQEEKQIADNVITFNKENDDGEIIELDSKKIDKTEPLDKIFTNGLKASENKEYQKAIDIFQTVLKTIPDSAPAFLNLAVLHYRIKDYTTARKNALRAIELGAETADKILQKIEKKLKKRKKTKVVKKTGKVIQKEKKEKQKLKKPVSKKEKGKKKPDEDTKKVTEKKEKKRLADKKPVIDKKPTKKNKKTVKTVDSKLNKRSLEKKKTIKPEALKTAPKKDIPPVPVKDTGTKKDDILPVPDAKSAPKPLSVNEYFALGLEASENRELDKAIEYFSIVTDMLPDAPPSFLNLANLYLDLKDFNKAQTNAQKAFDLGSQSAVLVLDKIDAAKNAEAKETLLST